MMTGLNEQLINDCLLSLLGGKDNEAWTNARKVGLSNEDLRDLLGEWWISGPGDSEPIRHSAKGGKNPRFYLGHLYAASDIKPTLAGAALLKRVRTLLEIPLPAEADMDRADQELEGATLEEIEAQPEPAEAAPALQGDSPYELVRLNLIKANPYQARQSIEMNYEEIQKLARGLKLKRETLPATCGLMQVPMARKVGDHYELAFGHRRLAAFRDNHRHGNAITGPDWSKMPLQIVELSDEEMYDFMARENGDREDLNDIQKAKSIQLAMDKFDWPLQRAAAAHGLAKSTGSNLTRLLSLPPEVQELVIKGVDNGGIGQRHAKELVRLVQAEPPMIEKCLELARDCAAHSPTADQVASRVTVLIEEQRVRLILLEKVKTLPCFNCGHPNLAVDPEPGGWLRCPGCGRSWMNLDYYETGKSQAEAKKEEKERDSQTFYRHCPTCGYKSPLTGRAIRLDERVTCEGCKRSLWPQTMPAELPAGSEVRFCSRCGSRRVLYAQQLKTNESVTCSNCRSLPVPAVVWLTQKPDEEDLQRAYEEARCPGCGGRVYYAKILNSLACERCSRRWNYTTEFRSEVAFKNAPKQKGERWASGQIHGAFTCQLCSQKYDRGGTLVRAWLEGGQEMKDVCSSCDRNRLELLRPACYLCNRGYVSRERGYIICNICESKWGSVAKFHAARDEAAKAVQVDPAPVPAGEFDCPHCGREKVVHVNGKARCLGCEAKWGSVADFHAERLIPSRSKTPHPGGIRCPKCEGRHLTHTGNHHLCFACKHEWTTPGNGSIQRRFVLHERVKGLTVIINQCATDALHQLETWFDQVEAAFPPPAIVKGLPWSTNPKLESEPESVSPGNTPEGDPAPV